MSASFFPWRAAHRRLTIRSKGRPNGRPLPQTLARCEPDPSHSPTRRLRGNRLLASRRQIVPALGWTVRTVPDHRFRTSETPVRPKWRKLLHTRARRHAAWLWTVLLGGARCGPSRTNHRFTNRSWQRPRPGTVPATPLTRDSSNWREYSHFARVPRQSNRGAAVLQPRFHSGRTKVNRGCSLYAAAG